MGSFNPLPSQEGRPFDPTEAASGQNVSIHSLRKKGDRERIGKTPAAILFQSTPFARRETVPGTPTSPIDLIVSIHSLRKKGDQLHRSENPNWNCFNPLPSQEGRP